ncbi:Uncharacterised protein [Weeksella virosa]|uniref:hypothetical protein n=1 Tax=Weeksella virosa TaxID=1014 RepID=UPI000E05D74A|nr:hypothetical protein [Weeksella virosa]SUP53545.1 Uncharacterised protein [Weeksella virosa]
MKNLYSLILTLICVTSYAQYISTTTSTTNYNKDLKHNGRVMFGDASIDDSWGFNNSVIHAGYTTPKTVLITMKHPSGRIEFGLVGQAQAHDPIARIGDGVLKVQGGKDFIFSFGSAGNPNGLPGQSGVQRYVFAGLYDSKTMSVYSTGKITMGTDKYDLSGYRLFVKDGIKTERLKVEVASANQWADHVFNDDYNLMPLNEVKTFINTNKHLPNIPSAKDVVADGGIEQGELNAKLLEKIEELTLHLIQQNEKIELLQKELEMLKK